MKKETKERKLNNKGFSLVELIIVIAIMAVLMAVLAPQFLRYVERSRLQSDNTAMSEIMRAAEIAAADEDVAAEIVAGGATGIVYTATGGAGDNKVFDFTGAAGAAGGAATPTDLDTEISLTVGNTVTLDSNTYTGAAAGPSIRMRSTAGVITVEVQNFFSDANQATPNATWTRIDEIN